MMGAGKSTVGPALARRLGLRFADCDAAVERAAGCTVAEIFERDGEAAFRKLEREAQEALAGEAAVVALGGGAIAQPGAPERLAASGTVVYLRARAETLAERLAATRVADRPLLAGAGEAAAPDARARLEALLAERREAYETAALVVDTDGLAVEDVVDALAAGLAEFAKRAGGAA